MGKMQPRARGLWTWVQNLGSHPGPRFGAWSLVHAQEAESTPLGVGLLSCLDGSLVGSDGLSVPAVDTVSHSFKLFHMVNSSVSLSWLGCSTIDVLVQCGGGGGCTGNFSHKKISHRVYFAQGPEN